MRNALISFFLVTTMLFGSTAMAQDDAPPAVDTLAAEEPVPDAAENASDGEAPTADTLEKTKEKLHAEGHEAGEVHTIAGVPNTDKEAIQTIVSLLEALKGQQWVLAIGLFLALLVYGVNRFALREKVNAKVIPWISFFVAVAGSVSAGIFSGTPAIDAFSAGLIAGSAAVGGWEAIVKHMLGPIGVEMKKEVAGKDA